MCLVGGRYRVTSYWRNQYAAAPGGALQGEADGRNRRVLDRGLQHVRVPDQVQHGHEQRQNLDRDSHVNRRRVLGGRADTVGGQTKEYHSVPGNQTLIYDPFFFVYP